MEGTLSHGVNGWGRPHAAEASPGAPLSSDHGGPDPAESHAGLRPGPALGTFVQSLQVIVRGACVRAGKTGPAGLWSPDSRPYFPVLPGISEGMVKPPPPSRIGGVVGAPALVFPQVSGLASQSGGQHGERCLAPVSRLGPGLRD